MVVVCLINEKVS